MSSAASLPPASLAALRDRIRQIEAPARHGVLPFEVAAIDRALPGGGLALGAVHEILGQGGDEEDGAAAAGFVAGILARLSPFHFPPPPPPSPPPAPRARCTRFWAKGATRRTAPPLPALSPASSPAFRHFTPPPHPGPLRPQGRRGRWLPPIQSLSALQGGEGGRCASNGRGG